MKQLMMVLTLLCGMSATARAGSELRWSICLHPEDETNGHTVLACPGGLMPTKGHAFEKLSDDRTMNCGLCAAEHRDSPELCKIHDVTCTGMRIQKVEADEEPETPRDDSPVTPEPPSRIVPRITLGPSLPSGTALIQNSRPR